MSSFSLTKSFYLIRHGQTDWNKKRIYQGANDIPLNATGEEQARSIIDQVKKIDGETFCVSPLKRAFRTAEIINKSLGKSFEVIPELMECQSKESAQFILSDKKLDYEISFDELPENHPEGPEEFVKRVRVGLEKSLQFPKPILVSHGGVGWAICRILGIESFLTPNCCVIEFNYSDGIYKNSILY
ncbi:MAG: histidine phosphatase family protein [Bdellovibrionales bacterium]|nr:histidine phosphatase family protein [Bdellovibrionales bacterium]NQZ19561.1 histidine phosphatase family protein [Bdellovibrionales bacterium]